MWWKSWSRNGIQQILFVTGRNKASIENHFDHDPELFRALTDAEQAGPAPGTGFRGPEGQLLLHPPAPAEGPGRCHPVRRKLRRREPFLVALGDSILGLHAVSRAVSRMADVFDSKRAQLRDRGGGSAAAKRPGTTASCSRKTAPDDVFRIVNLVEKPRPEDAPSNLAIAGRYIFSPLIFDMIRRVKPDKRGEIQLTDAIQFMCDEGRRVMAVKLTPEEKRYDIGNFPSYFESFVEFALADPVYGDGFPARAGAPAGESRRRQVVTQTRTSVSRCCSLLLAAPGSCHTGILWAEEGLPLAAARADAAPARFCTATSGSISRPAGARVLICSGRRRPAGSCAWPAPSTSRWQCWIACRFARDLWGEREGLWAAALLGFFLTFDFPSAVIPLASDLLMLAPHLAAVWMACARPCILERRAGGRRVPGECQGRVRAGGLRAVELAAPCRWLWALRYANAAAAAWLWRAGALARYIGRKSGVGPPLRGRHVCGGSAGAERRGAHAELGGISRRHRPGGGGGSSGGTARDRWRWLACGCVIFRRPGRGAALLSRATTSSFCLCWRWRPRGDSYCSRGRYRWCAGFSCC